MYPHFPLNVLQIELIISLLYQLTSLVLGFFIFVSIVLSITQTSKSWVMFSSYPQISNSYICFHHSVFPIHPFSPVPLQLSDPSSIHTLFKSYSIPYPLVSTSLDALGDNEMHQIRDLFVLDYLPSRLLKILDYFFPTNPNFPLVSDFSPTNKNPSFFITENVFLFWKITPNSVTSFFPQFSKFSTCLSNYHLQTTFPPLVPLLPYQ